MKFKSNEEIFKEYTDMGFDPLVVQNAWENVKGNEAKLLDEI